MSLRQGMPMTRPARTAAIAPRGMLPQEGILACRFKSAAEYASSGEYSMRIRDNSGDGSSFYSTNGVDVSSYSQIKIDFHFHPVGMETGEDFFVEFYDGSSWIMVGHYVSGLNFNNGIPQQITDLVINSATYSFTSGAKFKFRCDASSNDDEIFIDDVVISAQ